MSTKSYVYIISDKYYTKIGKANNVTKVVDTYRQGNPYKLVMQMTLECDSEEEAYQLQDYLHYKYRYSIVDDSTEWFKLNIINLIDISNEVSLDRLRIYPNFEVGQIELKDKIDKYRRTKEEERQAANVSTSGTRKRTMVRRTMFDDHIMYFNYTPIFTHKIYNRPVKKPGTREKEVNNYNTLVKDIIDILSKDSMTSQHLRETIYLNKKLPDMYYSKTYAKNNIKIALDTLVEEGTISVKTEGRKSTYFIDKN
jgi:hypothetical protein